MSTNALRPPRSAADTGAQVAAQVAAIRAVQARCPIWTADEPSAGPGEPCIAPVDLLAMADEEEARWTRWREGAA